MDADVAVVGTGTLGSMALWQLARRGVDAVGFERHAPGHDRGAAGGETRLFRLAGPEDAAYVPVMRRALDLWRELEAESERHLFEQCGGLTIGGSGQREIVDTQANAAANGIAVEVLDAAATAGRYPQHRLRPGEVAVLDRSAGLLRCDAAVLAASLAAQRHGARVVPYTPVREVAATGDHVEIRTDDRAWRVRHAVVAAGAWAGSLLPARLASRVEPRRILLNWFAADDVALYRPDRFPVFVRVTDGGSHYGGPTVDDVTVKIGGARPGRPVADPSTLQRRHDPDERDAARAAVASLFTGLHPEPVRSDAFTDLFVDDGYPLVGRGTPGVTLATGGSGLGFKMAPALAEAAATAATGGDAAPYPFLSPDR